MIRSVTLLVGGAVAALLLAIPSARADDVLVRVRKRFRVEEGGGFVAREKDESWLMRQTAVIVCDMWDAHHCLNAVRRAEEMVPRMNRVLEDARRYGALIVHAPSSCMAAYKDHPARQRAQAAPPAANLPKGIAEWCRQIPASSEERRVGIEWGSRARASRREA